MTNISNDEAWIATATGGQFSLSNPQPEQVVLADIAFALSKQCRFNGHCSAFYSVAEHCVLMTRFAERNGATVDELLHILLHDATEAYVGDMVAPLKNIMPDFRALEARVWDTIIDRFDLTTEQNVSVRTLDLRMLAREKEVLLPENTPDWACLEGHPPLPISLYMWTPRDAAREFIQTFVSLRKARQQARSVDDSHE